MMHSSISRLRHLLFVPLAFVALSVNAQAPNAASPPSAPSDSLKVVLLGTGVGPPVNLQQFGASTLVEAGGQRFLFDAGRGATLRLAQAGVPIGSVTRVFLTHLHSDHLLQLPDLLLAGWAGGQRAVPLDVWGPAGTRAMMEHLTAAFDFDIRMRRDVVERLPAAGITVITHEVASDGVVYAKDGVTVTAFLVDHGAARPAYGYRVDFAGRSVVLSGDTRVSENLVRYARGTDVLVHEVIDADALRNLPGRPSAASVEAILALHLTPAEAGEVFRRVAPRLAVYSHAPASEAVMAQTRTTYAGPLQGAEDLLTIRVGADIEVVRHPSGLSATTPSPAPGSASPPERDGQTAEHTVEEVRETIKRFYAAFNAHGWDRAAEFTTDDWVHVNPGGGITQGRSACWLSCARCVRPS